MEALAVAALVIAAVALSVSVGAAWVMIRQNERLYEHTKHLLDKESGR